MTKVRKRLCPAGHELPHATRKGKCSVLYCAVDRSKDVAKGAKQKTVPSVDEGVVETPVKLEPKSRKKKAEKALVIGPEDVGLPDPEDDGMQQQLAKAKGRFTTRMVELGVPSGLKGEAAETWADGRLVELLPLAVAEKEWNLRFGTPSERDKAATDVLNATGRGKRDAVNSGGPVIVLMGAAGENGQIQVPWAKKPGAQVVDVPGLVSKKESAS